MSLAEVALDPEQDKLSRRCCILYIHAKTPKPQTSSRLSEEVLLTFCAPCDSRPNCAWGRTSWFLLIQSSFGLNLTRGAHPVAAAWGAWGTGTATAGFASSGTPFDPPACRTAKLFTICLLLRARHRRTRGHPRNVVILRSCSQAPSSRTRTTRIIRRILAVYLGNHAILGCR